MTADEKRSEARIRSRGPVTILAAGLARIPGTIYDVSASGLGLDLETNSSLGLGVGTSVVIDGQGFDAEGVVRYCERLGPAYRVGVELKPAEPE
jgi:PilZ domain